MYFKCIFKIIINNNKNTVQDTKMRINTNVPGSQLYKYVISCFGRLVLRGESMVQRTVYITDEKWKYVSPIHSLNVIFSFDIFSTHTCRTQIVCIK
jgi:hypothetical protein